jgi:hypothetical protein
MYMARVTLSPKIYNPQLVWTEITKNVLIVVNGGAVPDGYYENPQLRVSQFANDPVVADSVSPETELAVSQWFAKGPRVLSASNAFLHVIQNFSLDLALKLLEIGKRALIVLNRPSQARSALARRYSSFLAFPGELRPGIGLRGLRGCPR